MKGPTTGAPAFSVSALLAQRKKEFDDYAQEQARELEGPTRRRHGLSISDETVTFEVLSAVGPILSYREMSGGYTAGTAHPTGYTLVGVRDLVRAAASPRLLDLFPEKQVVAALKADRWVRKFANPEGGFARATSVAELVAALDPDWAQENATGNEPDCSLDVSFGEGFGGMFYFHHVEKGRLAVRIAEGERRRVTSPRVHQVLWVRRRELPTPRRTEPFEALHHTEPRLRSAQVRGSSRPGPRRSGTMRARTSNCCPWSGACGEDLS